MHCCSISLLVILKMLIKRKWLLSQLALLCKRYGMKCFTSFQYSFFMDFGCGGNILLRQSPLFHPFQMAKLSEPSIQKNAKKNAKKKKKLRRSTARALLSTPFKLCDCIFHFFFLSHQFIAHLLHHSSSPKINQIN